MKRFLIPIFTLLTGVLLFADISSRLNIRSEDATVNTYPYQARFTNGNVTDNGDGTVSISVTGGGGGGSSSLETIFGSARSSPTATLKGAVGQFTGSVTGSTMTMTLDPSSVTLQGNTFNAASKLLQLDGSAHVLAAQMPALTGDVTTVAGAVATTAAALQNNITTIGSSLTVTGGGGILVTYGVSAASFTIPTVTASRPAKWDSNRKLVGATIDLTSSNEVANQLGASFFPVLTGDITTAGGALATTAAALQNNITTFGSSVTVTNKNGLVTTYQVSAGSFTGAGLSTCGDSTHGLGWSSTDNKFTCANITGSGGGGGASTLGISSGSATTSVVVSSPTGNVVFDSNTFITALQGSTSAFIKIDPSSATLLGNTFNAASKLLQLDGSGFVPAAQMPALTGDVTTSAGAVATTAAARQANITTLAASSITVTGNTEVDGWDVHKGSMTISGAGGLGVTYNVNVGSVTGAGLSACGDSSHALSWSSTSNQFGCQSITGSGGSPGGSNYNVQVASAGAFAGMSDFNVHPSSVVIGATYTTYTSTLNVNSSMTVVNAAGLTLNNMTYTNNIGTNTIIQDNGLNYIVYPSSAFVITASTSDISTVLTDLPMFRFSMGPTETWVYDCQLSITGAAGGSEYGVDGPTGATTMTMIFGDVGAVGTFSTAVVTALTTADTVAFGTVAAAINITVRGEMTTSSTAGSWNLMRKAVTPTSTSLNAGSWCSARRTL